MSKTHFYSLPFVSRVGIYKITWDACQETPQKMEEVDSVAAVWNLEGPWCIDVTYVEMKKDRLYVHFILAQ